MKTIRQFRYSFLEGILVYYVYAFSKEDAIKELKKKGFEMSYLETMVNITEDGETPFFETNCKKILYGKGVTEDKTKAEYKWGKVNIKKRRAELETKEVKNIIECSDLGENITIRQCFKKQVAEYPETDKPLFPICQVCEEGKRWKEKLPSAFQEIVEEYLRDLGKLKDSEMSKVCFEQELTGLKKEEDSQDMATQKKEKVKRVKGGAKCEVCGKKRAFKNGKCYMCFKRVNGYAPYSKQDKALSDEICGVGPPHLFCKPSKLDKRVINENNFEKLGKEININIPCKEHNTGGEGNFTILALIEVGQSHFKKLYEKISSAAKLTDLKPQDILTYIIEKKLSELEASL